MQRAWCGVCTMSRAPAGTWGCTIVVVACIHPKIPEACSCLQGGGCEPVALALGEAVILELPSLGGRQELQLLLLGFVVLLADSWLLSCPQESRDEIAAR